MNRNSQRHSQLVVTTCASLQPFHEPTLRAHLSLMGFYILRSMSATLVAFLMVMCATPAGCSDPDPYGLVFNRNPLSWADAEAHCVSLGGNLASVSSEAMARHIDVNYVRGGGACHATWIGYNDRATEGDWVWTGAASSYTNWWQPSEPNDKDSGEDCASLGVDCIYGFWGVASGWADSGCSPGDYEYHARASICQVGVPALSRYSFHSSPKSWHAAREDCQSRGGDLASIHSEAENREALALTGGRDTWLGLNGEEDEHNYVWSDGTPMDYHGWAPGQPNNYGGDEDCGGYWSGRNNGRWDDMFGGASCSSELAYICNTAAPIGAPYDPADYSCQPNPFKCDSSILGDCCTARATSREERRCSPGWIPIYTGVLPLLRRCHSCVHPGKGLCFRPAALSTELLPRPCTVPHRKIMLGRQQRVHLLLGDMFGDSCG